MDREQQSSRPGATRATPPKTQSKSQVGAAKPKTAQSRAKAAGQTPSATTAPDIMSRLPKSRPQRASQRRGGPAKTAAKGASGATAAQRKPAATSQKRPAPTAAGRPATARGAAPARPPAAGGGNAPGLPRLAIDGATEAIKLPVKVSGRLTLKALDAVARGLRRR